MTFEKGHILISSQSLDVLGLHDLTVLMISFSTTWLKNRVDIMCPQVISYRDPFLCWKCIGKIGPYGGKKIINSFAMVNLSDISSPLHSNCFGKSFGHLLIDNGI